MALILSGCSVVQSLYNNSPQLVYWWLDDYLDFRQDQRDWVKAQLQDILAWHRTQQLPLYLSSINQLTDLARGDIAPEVGCAFVQTLADTHKAWLEQWSAPLAVFLASLSRAQVQYLHKAFERKNKDWAKEWLQVSDKERLDQQTDKGIEQAQDLYGTLSATQKDALRHLAQDSGYDAKKSLALRHARQDETLRTIEILRGMSKTPDKGFSLTVASEGPRLGEQSANRNAGAASTSFAPAAGPSQASQAVVREWLEKLLDPVDPSLRAYNTLRWNMNCQASSRFHALTTPQQRERARVRLTRYAKDAQALMGTAP